MCRLNVDYIYELIFRIGMRDFYRAKLMELQIYNNLNITAHGYCWKKAAKDSSLLFFITRQISNQVKKAVAAGEENIWWGSF